MTLRNPPAEARAPMRCKRSLAAGVNVGIGAVVYEIIPVFGAFRTRIRAKAAVGMTLDIIAVGPDFEPDQEQRGIAFASLKGTLYTTANPTQLALAAGVEGNKDLDLYGEGYLILKVTGGAGAGILNYVDVLQLPNCG